MSDNQVRIAHANPTDALKIIEYLKLVGNETDNLSFSGDSILINEIDEASMIASISKMNNSCMILAWLDDRIIGIGSLEGLTSKRFSHRSSLGVSVKKDYWGLGIGTHLIDELIEYAYEHNLDVLDLEVITSNERAIKLYQSFGFEIIGTYRNYSKVGDKSLDAYVMILDLLPD
ncbi:MAG: GNAT family N-acetyltransferase [Erysipelotrichaceae bacterium]|nr:GNAT family N-acetyltransferase [Erysipelotrichaceae bacterium]MDD3810119.1 GNAT family N-acetyltransferase [Erysipelotrichaceae bacterium]